MRWLPGGAILLDTPGGLATADEASTGDSLAIPLIVYVSPEGLRAASAASGIGQAADILAWLHRRNTVRHAVSVGGEDIQKIYETRCNDADAS